VANNSKAGCEEEDIEDSDEEEDKVIGLQLQS
jgi:hypothetical protein